ncbi:hypothetical protein HPY86_04315 [candidate division WOR-3 bacterium]|nr:hypothetical protein [candidate division WOR-3 bacterium]
MAIIIINTKKDTASEPIIKSEIEPEEKLREVIMKYPEILSLCDIKKGVKLCIVAEEFWGIGLIGIDRDGEIYIIDTRSYKKRGKEVVANLLECGASLYNSEFNEFIAELDKNCKNVIKQNVEKRLADFYKLDGRAVKKILQNLYRNFDGGKFKFVVPVDKLDENLNSLIDFINKNSNFTIYAVELELYKHNIEEIFNSKLYKAEDRLISTKETQNQIKEEAINKGVGELYEQLVQGIRPLFLRMTPSRAQEEEEKRRLLFVCRLQREDAWPFIVYTKYSDKKKGLYCWLQANDMAKYFKTSTTNILNLLPTEKGYEPPYNEQNQWYCYFKTKSEVDRFINGLKRLKAQAEAKEKK